MVYENSGWKRIEPELYYHALTNQTINAENRDQLAQKVRELTVNAFREIYGFDVDVEVTVKDGSIKLWIAISAVVAFLSTYGSIRSGAETLFKDIRYVFSWVANQIGNDNRIGPEISVQRRLGVIGRIDQALYEWENEQISRKECTDRLMHLFELVDQAPNRSELIQALVDYVDIRYGGQFRWDQLASGARRIDLLSPPHTEGQIFVQPAQRPKSKKHR